MTMKRIGTSLCCALSLAALLVPAASYAAQPDACTNIAASAGAVPADLAALCAAPAAEGAPPLTPTSLATSPDGVLTQCASMTLNNPENVTTLGSIQFRPACDFANNDFTKLYCMTFDVPAAFSSVDPATCAETVLGTSNNFQSFSGMAWDASTGTMYGSTTDVATSNLYTINLSNGAATLVGGMTNAPGNIALGVDTNGDLYGFDIVLDSLLKYNKANGAGTVIGSLGFDANFAQGMDFDGSDNTCYIFAFNNGTFQAELRTCNVATGNTTLVGVIGSSAPGGLQEWTGPGIMEPEGGGDRCGAFLRVPDGVHAAGSKVPVNVHIVHVGTDTVKKAWTVVLADGSGRTVATMKMPPHTLKPNVPYNGSWQMSLPKDLKAGTYNLSLKLPNMKGIEGARTTITVQ